MASIVWPPTCRLLTESLVAVSLTSVTAEPMGLPSTSNWTVPVGGTAVAVKRYESGGEGEGLAVGRGRAGVGRQGDRGVRGLRDGQVAVDGGEVVVSGAKVPTATVMGYWPSKLAMVAVVERMGAPLTTLVVSPLTRPERE